MEQRKNKKNKEKHELDNYKEQTRLEKIDEKKFIESKIGIYHFILIFIEKILSFLFE